MLLESRMSFRQASAKWAFAGTAQLYTCESLSWDWRAQRIAAV